MADCFFVCFSGLILGCGLIYYVCVLSDEFGPSREGRTESSADFIRLMQGQHSGPTPKIGDDPRYYYGWSFFLAVLGFLGAEFSAVLCLTAFLNRFDSEVSATPNIYVNLTRTTHCGKTASYLQKCLEEKVCKCKSRAVRG